MMDTLGYILQWLGLGVLILLAGMVFISVWVYTGVKAYYRAMIDAYREGAKKVTETKDDVVQEEKPKSSSNTRSSRHH